jgi:hypothetical protein
LFIPDPDPDPDFYTSRITGSKRHRIPDPQHWLKFKFSYLDGLLVESVQIRSEALQLLAELGGGSLEVRLLRLHNGVLRLQGQQLKNKIKMITNFLLQILVIETLDPDWIRIGIQP